MNDTPNCYGVISRAFHWLMAVLILLQFMKFFDRISDGEHWIGQTIVPTHGSLGLILLVLVVLRVLWAVKQRGQRPVVEGALATFAKVGHGLLYLCMILMPVTGALFVLGRGYPLRFFGTPIIPGSGTQTDWMIALGNLHSPIAWLFLLLVLGHVAAAVYHHLALKDDTLRRMLGRAAG